MIAGDSPRSADLSDGLQHSAIYLLTEADVKCHRVCKGVWVHHVKAVMCKQTRLVIMSTWLSPQTSDALITNRNTGCRPERGLLPALLTLTAMQHQARCFISVRCRCAKARHHLHPRCQRCQQQRDGDRDHSVPAPPRQRRNQVHDGTQALPVRLRRREDCRTRHARDFSGTSAWSLQGRVITPLRECGAMGAPSAHGIEDAPGWNCKAFDQVGR